MYETFNTIFDRLVLSKVSIHDGYYTVKKKNLRMHLCEWQAF